MRTDEGRDEKDTSFAAGGIFVKDKMTALVKGTLEKMEHLTEEEFSKMDLTPYLTELLEDKEWI